MPQVSTLLQPPHNAREPALHSTAQAKTCLTHNTRRLLLLHQGCKRRALSLPSWAWHACGEGGVCVVDANHAHRAQEGLAVLQASNDQRVPQGVHPALHEWWFGLLLAAKPGRLPCWICSLARSMWSC